MQKVFNKQSLEVYLGDCADFLKICTDKQFDLAIIDPPYGIGEDGSKNHTRTKLAKSKFYEKKNWDNFPPSKEFFIELQRVSKNQIIFGANHFIENIPSANSSCWIVWDKDNGKTHFADCELAWTSFSTSVRKFKWRWQGFLQEDMKNKDIRIHPTQKPVGLYKWILEKYAKLGDKILDTHAGSLSLACACKEMKFEGVFIEKEEDYLKLGIERLEKYAPKTTASI